LIKAFILKLSFAFATLGVALCANMRVHANEESRWCIVTNKGGSAITWDCEYDTSEECASAVAVTGGFLRDKSDLASRHIIERALIRQLCPAAGVAGAIAVCTPIIDLQYCLVHPAYARCENPRLPLAESPHDWPEPSRAPVPRGFALTVAFTTATTTIGPSGVTLP
jgi:hypothetical protein